MSERWATKRKVSGLLFGRARSRRATHIVGRPELQAFAPGVLVCASRSIGVAIHQHSITSWQKSCARIVGHGGDEDHRSGSVCEIKKTICGECSEHAPLVEQKSLARKETQWLRRKPPRRQKQRANKPECCLNGPVADGSTQDLKPPPRYSFRRALGSARSAPSKVRGAQRLPRRCPSRSAPILFVRATRARSNRRAIALQHRR